MVVVSTFAARPAALLAAVLAALALLAGPVAGSASAAATTVTRGSGNGGTYALQTITVQGTKVVPRWNPCQSAITYRVNLSGVPKKKRAALLHEVRTAFGKLSAADGIRYRYAGTTSFVPKQGTGAHQPAEIVVAAVPRSRTNLSISATEYGFGGSTWVSWWGQGGVGAALVRGYVLLNPALFLPLRSGFGAGKTQGNVILHELGHASGLEHVHSEHEQMNPILTNSSPAGYGKGDLAALHRIGVHGGCVDIPAGVSIRDLT